jgi:hypothetical protein
MDAEIKKQHFGYSITLGDYYITINHDTARLQNSHGNYKNFSEILQYLKTNFPSLKRVEFDDNSKITVNKKPKDQPSEKSFLLSYFYIAKYGKTWFEDNFSAKMKNSEDYLLYREATNILKQPIKISFQDFVNKAQFTDEQAQIMEKYFDSEISWNDFFNRIPDNLQYFSCFGWLSSFINSLLKNTYNMNVWYINFT